MGWFKVVGDSMRPTLAPGEEVFALSLPRWLLRPGALVVAAPRGGPFIIKRIARVLETGLIELASDNAAASSPFVEQPLAKREVVGLVVWIRGRGVGR